MFKSHNILKDTNKQTNDKLKTTQDLKRYPKGCSHEQCLKENQPQNVESKITKEN